METIYLGLKRIPNYNVYYKKDIPDKYNFKNSPRIGDLLKSFKILAKKMICFYAFMFLAPIVAVADESYVLNTVKQTLKGNHGFNNRYFALEIDNLC